MQNEFLDKLARMIEENKEQLRESGFNPDQAASELKEKVNLSKEKLKEKEASHLPRTSGALNPKKARRAAKAAAKAQAKDSDIEKILETAKENPALLNVMKQLEKELAEGEKEKPGEF